MNINYFETITIVISFAIIVGLARVIDFLDSIDKEITEIKEELKRIDIKENKDE